VTGATVVISRFRYVPATVTVKAGGTVTWTNRDFAPHTATTKTTSSFNTGTLNRFRSKRITFSRPGVYRYGCLFHGFMNGTVVVT
jgi:plastocyanin